MTDPKKAWENFRKQCPHFALLYEAAEELMRKSSGIPSKDGYDYSLLERQDDFSDLFIQRIFGQEDEKMGTTGSIARVAIDELMGLPLAERNERLEELMYLTQGMRNESDKPGSLEREIDRIEGFVRAVKSMQEGSGEGVDEWRLRGRER